MKTMKQALSRFFSSVVFLGVLMTAALQAQTFLVNVDFGAGTGPSPKTGFAALGETTNDFWNFYSRDGNGGWLTFGAVTNLVLADHTATTIGLTVSNAPGAWNNGSTDSMYATYIYPLSGGNVTIMVTNLPAGNYQVLPYSSDGNFEVTVGGTSYGIKHSYDTPVTNPPAWTQGEQYALFTNVVVAAGQPLVLTVRPGVYGYATISGLQIQTNVPPPPAVSLINVDFGAGAGPSPKSGFAALGQQTNDFWNFYTRDGNGGWLTFGVVTNLLQADQTATTIGLTVSNAPGAWNNGSTDPMYATYIYPFNGGNVTVTVTNLPPGTYTVLPYSSDGDFEVTVGGTSYGIKHSYDTPVTNPPAWTQGEQYALFTNVVVATGQPLVLTVRPGVYGYATISGLQIHRSVTPPPPPSISLIDVDFGAGSGPSPKAGFAAIGQTTNDFWNFYTRDGNGGWLIFGTVTNLLLVDHTATTVGLTVSNAPGAWNNGSTDPMYATYIYPFNGGNVTVTVTNLPPGAYSVLPYSSDGNFEVTVGGTSYGLKNSYDTPVTNPPTWTEGGQYVDFVNVVIGAGQPLVLTVRPGVYGYATISGLQIASGSTAGIPPVIANQPVSQTALVGANVTFSVAANGTMPIAYQWQVNGTNITDATNSTLTLPNVLSSQAGSYLAIVSNSAGSVKSSPAVLKVEALPSAFLLDVDFGATAPSPKTGFAALGEENSDFWNFYSRNGSNGSWLTFGVLPNLVLVDRTLTPAGLTVSNAPGAWGNGSTDPMYNTYIYPFDGSDITIAVTNLPPGQYTVLPYSSDGNFEVSVGGLSYGVQRTYDTPVTNPPVWTEGEQYARYTKVQISAGQQLVLTVRPGVYGYATISGLQLAYGGGTGISSPPSISQQPFDQTVSEGGTARFQVAATGTPPFNYQWEFDGSALKGQTSSSLALSNVQPANAGNYSVLVSNPGGAVLSSNAVLTVLPSTGTNCVPAPSGLAGWWRGEGNANDELGTNNGVASGGLTYAPGEVGRAFDLNGTNQYVLVEAQPNLNVGTGSGMTFEGWIKPTTLSVQMPIFEFERVLGSVDPADVGVQYYINLPAGGGGPGAFFANFVDTTGANHMMNTSSNLISAGAWQHIALTYDEASGIGTFYLNGLVVTQRNLGTFTPQTSFTNLVLGARTYQGSASIPSDKFAGEMDELSFYSRALTATEIAAIYNAGSAGKCPMPPPGACVPPPSGLVGWWRAEGNANDAVGNDNGVISGNVTFGAGEVGQGFEFDGSTSAVTIPASTNLAVQSLTIEAWIFPPDTTHPRPIVEYGAATGVDYVELWYGTQGYGYDVPGAVEGLLIGSSGASLPLYTPPGLVLSNQWNHVAMTFDYATQTAVLYVNGMPGATNTSSVVFAPVTTVPVNLGYRPAGSSLGLAGTRDLGGLDEVSIYNRALSASEIQAIYSAGSAGKCPGEVAPNCVPAPAGIISWWPAEGDARDIVGTNSGVLANGTGFALGEVGQAFAFNGVDQVMQVADSPSLNPTNLTLEGWVYVQSYSSNDAVAIVGKDDPYSYRQYLIALAHVSTNWVLRAHVGVPAGFEHFNGTVPIQLQTWYHIAMTYDGSFLRLYVNGALDSSMAVSGPILPTPDPLLIGGSVPGPWDFNGRIDELSLYGRALSPAEIQSIYAAGSDGKCRGLLAPQINSQPASQTVDAGSTATFRVVATGSQPLEYQWEFKGSALPSQTNSSLVLSNVQPADAGNYAVLVSNAGGAILSSNASLTVLPPTNCIPAPAGLVGWWRAEGNANDAVGNDNGVISGNVTFGAGEVGQGFEFDGSTSAVTIPASPNLAVQSLTIEAWIFPPDTTHPRPIVEYGAATGIDYVELWYGTQGYGYDVDGAVEGLLIGSSGESLWLYTPPGLVLSNQWNHVAMTFDYATQTAVLYVNGKVGATNTSSVAFSPVTDVPVNIGYRPAGSTVGLPGTRHLGGLDEVSIYNRALSASEVSSIYSAGSAGKCPGEVAPTVTLQPVTQTVNAGGTAVFNVSATGTAPLEYQWQFNGGSLPGQTNSSLLLSNVQPASAGNYGVLVSNATGSVLSSNALLTVLSSAPTNCVPAPAGIISWWPAEGDARDIAGTNSGVLVNGTSFAPGEVGQAFAFNGVDQVVQVPDSPSLNPTNLTLEGWVYVQAYSSNDAVAIVGKDDPYSYREYLLGLAHVSTNWVFRAHVGVPAGFELFNGTVPIQLQTWYHVAMTYDGSFLRLYVNGALDSSMAVSGPIVSTPDPLLIGGSVPGPWDFNGRIDELSLYRRALSPAEIQSIYAAGSGGKCREEVSPLISSQPASQTVRAGGTASFTVIATGSLPLSYQWEFNGSALSGQTNSSLVLSNVQPADAGNYAALVSNPGGALLSSNASLTILSIQTNCVPRPANLVSWWRAESNPDDAAGTNDGTLMNWASFAPGKVGQAFQFNGVNQFVQVPDSPGLNPTNSLTIEGWVYVNAYSSNDGVVIVGKDNPYAIRQYLLGLGNVGGEWFFRAHIGVPTGLHYFNGATAVQLHTWYHVAMTYDGANLKLYVNGLLDGSMAVTGPITTSTEPLLIGGSVPGPWYFSGLVDELSLYNRALTPSEILAIYGADTAGKCTEGLPLRACNVHAGALENQAVYIPISELLLLGSPSGPSLTLSSVSLTSTNGGTVTLQTDSIVYVPPTNYIGPDRFTYTISNGTGATASAYVLVSVRPQLMLSGTALRSPAASNGFQGTFAGNPGHTYIVQKAPSVTGPWTNIGTVTVGANGIGIFTDSQPTSGTAFYRTVSP